VDAVRQRLSEIVAQLSRELARAIESMEGEAEERLEAATAQAAKAERAQHKAETERDEAKAAASEANERADGLRDKVAWLHAELAESQWLLGERADASTTPGGAAEEPADASTTPGGAAEEPADASTTPGGAAEEPADASTTPIEVTGEPVRLEGERGDAEPSDADRETAPLRERDILEAMTVRELKKMASELSVSVPSRAKKPDIVRLLLLGTH
jgi:hypothetical protein